MSSANSPYQSPIKFGSPSLAPIEHCADLLMPNYMTLATCSLNQWALDWEGNVDRIISSIREAKVRNATLRVGPELEITGYGCYDHFLESDTFLHSWEMLSRILRDVSCRDILLDIGMPVMVRVKPVLELIDAYRPIELTQNLAS